MTTTYRRLMLHGEKMNQEFINLQRFLGNVVELDPDDPAATGEAPIYNAATGLWEPGLFGGIYLGDAQVTANQTAIGAGEEDLTSLTVTTATLEAGRRLKITGFANLSAVSATSAILEIKEGTTILAQAHHTLPALHLRGVYVCALVSPSAAAHTYKLTASSTATDMVMDAGTDHPAFILVEDITASPGGGGAPSSAWTDYTPTWTSDSTDPAIVNGTLKGAYRVDGKTLFFRITIVMGSSTTYGSTNWAFGLPSGKVAKTSTSIRQIVKGWGFDTSASAFRSFISHITTGGTEFNALNISTNTFVGSAIPWTWASGDEVQISGTIEID